MRAVIHRRPAGVYRSGTHAARFEGVNIAKGQRANLFEWFDGSECTDEATTTLMARRLAHGARCKICLRPR
jgi:hypothetical protein